MREKTVRFPPELDDRLAAYHKAYGTGQSEFIRRAVDEKLRREGFPPGQPEPRRARRAKQPA